MPKKADIERDGEREMERQRVSVFKRDRER